jgi:ribose transport system permease protein
MMKRSSWLAGPYLGLFVVIALFVVLIGLKGGLEKFLSFRNLQLIVHESTIPGVVALGMLLVIVSGGIDLSVGSVIALVTVTTMQTYRLMFHGPETIPWASTIAVSVGIITGALCGLTNGWVITKLRLTPFVATLGMFGIARGLAVWLSGRTLISFPKDGTPEWVSALARVHVPVIQFNPGFWSLVALSVLTAILLRRTILGRHIYAIGSNEATARLCGVRVDRAKVWVYTLAGALTGWAGILLLSQGASGDPSAGEALELQVIAAVVIGGAQLGGGRGAILGTLTGVLILQVLNNGVGLFNVPVEMQYILVGAIIIVNTALARWHPLRQGVNS